MVLCGTLVYVDFFSLQIKLVPKWNMLLLKWIALSYLFAMTRSDDKGIVLSCGVGDRGSGPAMTARGEGIVVP